MKEFKVEDQPKLKPGFNTPDGYFETFSERILAQLPKDETKVISLFRTRKTWYYASVAALTVMLAVPLYINYSKSTVDVESEVIEDYLTYNSSITEDEIANLLETEDVENIKIDLQLQKADLEEVLLTNAELEKHLIN